MRILNVIALHMVAIAVPFMLGAQSATGRTGNHHPDGFSIVIERGGERGSVAERGDVLDLKPMVYQRLGVDL